MPISAILFGGRRRTTVPLVTQAFDWEHGVFLGSIMASETTAAQQGAVGNLRFDPMAMLPFCGYNMADYFAHWLAIGKDTDPTKLPKIFFVNWFRRDEDGRFLWPGYGENSRVLKWVFERVAGTAERGRDRRSAACRRTTRSTPTGLDVAADDLETLLSVDADGLERRDPADPRALRPVRRRLPRELHAWHSSTLEATCSPTSERAQSTSAGIEVAEAEAHDEQAAEAVEQVAPCRSGTAGAVAVDDARRR